MLDGAEVTSPGTIIALEAFFEVMIFGCNLICFFVFFFKKSIIHSKKDIVIEVNNYEEGLTNGVGTRTY